MGVADGFKQQQQQQQQQSGAWQFVFEVCRPGAFSLVPLFARLLVFGGGVIRFPVCM